MKPTYLTEKQFLFCEAYLRTGNKAESAREAGYSGQNLTSVGSRMLTSNNVKRYFRERQEKFDSERIADANEVLAYFTKIMRDEDINISERTRCAEDLLKHLSGESSGNAPVSIKIDIPKPEEMLQISNVKDVEYEEVEE